jgi:DNA-binding IclR family transcriptional regulator
MSAHTIRWYVTHHAGERYASRVEPRLSADEAVAYLRRALPDATLLPERTWGGQERWLLVNRKAIVVARRDHVRHVHVAVTVIGPEEREDDDTENEVVAAFRRATALASGAAR